jgi:redox-sensitive bicupin YhaK (pirin superfamily)
MLQKINSDQFIDQGSIKILYPGLSLGTTDSGFASIGRIDHAFFNGEYLIRMHPHVNDEILTYLRSGHVEHIDSEGFKKPINNTTLMLMRAGYSFFHEEKIIDQGEPLEGLQLFIRPSQKNLQSNVAFMELDNAFSYNEWRLIASPSEDTPLQFTSHTWIYDIKAYGNKNFQLPKFSNQNLTCLLYVFSGSLNVNSTIELFKKDALLIKNETIEIHTKEETELVLLVTDEHEAYYDGGIYSGNQI